MSVLFVQYPKCGTCRNAKKWLEENNVQFNNRHIVEETPTKEELSTWIRSSKLPIKKFFNTSGMIYREMQLKDKLPSMSEDEQLNLLASNGMLIKRPILIKGNEVLVGFKEADWDKLLR